MAFVSDDDGRTWQGGLMLDERDDLTSFGHPLPANGVDASRQKEFVGIPDDLALGGPVESSGNQN